MISSNQRAARAALDAARSSFERLSILDDPSAISAGVSEAWTQAEGVLRALIGSTTLSGQELVRELRQRDMVTLSEADRKSVV